MASFHTTLLLLSVARNQNEKSSLASAVYVHLNLLYFAANLERKLKNNFFFSLFISSTL
jgi:hypothetical protein